MLPIEMTVDQVIGLLIADAREMRNGLNNRDKYLYRHEDLLRLAWQESVKQWINENQCELFADEKKQPAQEKQNGEG